MLSRLRSRPVVAPSPTDVDAVVRLAYRAVLHREPDDQGLVVYRKGLRNGQDLAWLIKALLASSEFRAMEARFKEVASASAVSQVEPAHELSQQPPMTIDTHCSEAELQALWDHVSQTWSQLGQDEPHWSVLTVNQFRAEALGDSQLAEFYGSGDFEVERLNTWLRRSQGCSTLCDTSEFQEPFDAGKCCAVAVLAERA